MDRTAVVSGSASAITAAQVAWAESRGWPVIPLDTVALFGPNAQGVIAAATDKAIAALAQGRNPIVAALRGLDDPALAATRAAIAQPGLSPAEGKARIGDALGAVLAALVDRGVGRVLVCGGDTSGRVTRELGVVALEPLAWIAHGASLMRGHRPKGAPVEIILKGGQMGPEDLFERALVPQPDPVMVRVGADPPTL